MFVMNADISIGKFKPVKPVSMQWKHSVDSYADMASFVIPAMCRMVREGEVYSQVNTASLITEGMPVTMTAGYNGNTREVFKGYISRIKYSVPLEVECEGFSYLLRRIVFTKSYPSTTVKQILNDLVNGTPLTVHTQAANVNLPAVRFDRVAGTEVLEYLKKNLMSVYFIGAELYAGIQQLPVTKSVKYRLNWNTVGDSGLSFGEMPKAIVNFQVEKKNADGSRNKSKGSPIAPGVKVKRVTIDYSQSDLDALEKKETEKEQQKGFEGSITAFLLPVAAPGMAVQITDARYPERSGKYFVEEVSGSLSASGGRLSIKLGNRL